MIYTLHIHLTANKSKHKNTKTKNKFRPSFFMYSVYSHIPNIYFLFYYFIHKAPKKNNIIGIDVLTMCEIDLLIAEKYNL